MKPLQQPGLPGKVSKMNEIIVECPKCKGKFDPLEYEVDVKLQGNFSRIKESTQSMQKTAYIGFVIFFLIACFMPGELALVFIMIGIFWFVYFSWLWKAKDSMKEYGDLIFNIAALQTYDLLCPYCGELLTFKKDKVIISNNK